MPDSTEKLRTNVEWEYWGEHDPLWAVARVDGKDSASGEAWKAAEFLAMGASDFRDVLNHWRHYGLQGGTCVEIGAGSGRMTRQLVTVFERVLALDVSRAQLDLAQRLLEDYARKVDFRVVTAPQIPSDNGSCDAMFSCHVFQHLPNLGVTTYLTEAARVLKPGGTVCFHVPVSGAHLTSPQSSAWYALRNAYKRLKRALGFRRIAEYHRYSAPGVINLLRDLGFTDVELRIFPMRSNGDYHSYFFGRKPLTT